MGSKSIRKWCEKEFSFLEFGDRRLERRFIQTAEQLCAAPSASIFEAFPEWRDSKAAYRLFDNERASSKRILFSHQKNTQSRVRGLERVLVIQDTSFLNYHSHPHTKNLGRIGNFKRDREAIRGLIMHTSLAVSTTGVPMGIFGQSIWARDLKKFKSKYSRKIRDRESYKWLQGLDETRKWIPEGVQCITICDREADFYQFFEHAFELEMDFLVRVRLDRVVKNSDDKIHMLWNEMAQSKSVAKIEVDVTQVKNKQETHRVAQVEVKYSKVLIYPPARGDGEWKQRLRSKVAPPKKFEIYVVQVIEPNPPAGMEALEWMLMTSVPVTSPKEALERVSWYKQRWHIENFHKALKSGCQVEECRLQTADRLKRYITLFSIIAWRLYWILHLSRVEPEKTSTTVLSEEELEILAIYSTTKRETKDLPRSPPTLHQAILWIARMGGFKGRKLDGEPGIIVLWRGWEKLQSQIPLFEWKLNAATYG